MSQETTQSKPESVEALVGQLQSFIRVAAATGSAAHDVERELFKRLLQLGWLLLQQFFALLGNGDEGEYVELAEGRLVKRLEKPQRRGYRSIFGLMCQGSHGAHRHALDATRRPGYAPISLYRPQWAMAGLHAVLYRTRNHPTVS